MPSSDISPRITRFLTLDFTFVPEDALARQLIAQAGQQRFGYVVTPNVDHMVQLLEGQIDETAYRAAQITLNDSRILSALARLVGKDLPATPGSDLVACILALPEATALRIAVIGPSQDEFDRLKLRYPHHTLQFIAAPPALHRGSADWEQLKQTLCTQNCDLMLLCLSFPKQEYLAHDLLSAGRQGGLAICAGASVDFLTGRQKRAPRIWQRLGLEWAHRLGANPRRMWRRYMVRGPRIFGHVLRREVFGRRGADP